MSVEAIVIQAGQGKALSLRCSQVAYKAEGQRPAGGSTFLEFTAGGQYRRSHPSPDRGVLLRRRGRVPDPGPQTLAAGEPRGLAACAAGRPAWLRESG